jgi:tetratricopeptide (TPR) repeat protein
VTDKTSIIPTPSPVSPPLVAPVLSPEILFLRHAEDLVAAGQREQALDHLRQLIQDFPEQTRGYLRIASLLKEERRWKEAQEILKVAVERSPECQASWRALVEVCLEIGAYDDVLGYAQRLLKYQPRSLFARDALIAAYIQRGQMEKALFLLRERLRLTPTDPWIHFQQGALLRHIGDVAGATRAFERALQYTQEQETENKENRENRENIEMAADIRLALEMLERYQVHQIVLLASEDLAFSLQINQASEEKVQAAIEARGFYLSPVGISLLRGTRKQGRLTVGSAPSRILQYH